MHVLLLSQDHSYLNKSCLLSGNILTPYLGRAKLLYEEAGASAGGLYDNTLCQLILEGPGYCMKNPEQVPADSMIIRCVSLSWKGQVIV